jgi:HEAT repeat protein
MKKQSVNSLIKKLKDKDSYVRYWAARALGRIGEKAAPAVPALIEALKDENRDVRYWAADTLGDIGKKAAPAVPALVEALKDENRHVAVEAAFALGKIGEKAASAVPALIEMLKDPLFSCTTLVQIGDKAVPALREAFEKNDSFLFRYRVAVTLGKMSEKRTPAMMKITKDAEELFRQCKEAFKWEFGWRCEKEECDDCFILKWDENFNLNETIKALKCFIVSKSNHVIR